MTGMTDMMKKAVIVYGAGISWRGAAAVLAQLGQQVFLYNDNPCTIEQELQVALQAAGGALIIGEAAFAATLAQVGLVVLSPGVPCDNKNVLLAECMQDVEVISEVELAYRLYKGHMAAITGTNGKTTTTTIVGEMFKCLHVPSAVGGNIGLALSKEV